MSSINLCMFTGRVGKDPDVRTTTTGKTVATCSLAVSDKYKGNESTEWVNLEFWAGLADVVSQYVRKGYKLVVVGRLKTDSWEADGVKKYKTKIVVQTMEMLDKPAQQEIKQTGEDDDSVPF